MNCVVLAGGRPGENDPLYQYTGGNPKALLKFGERTMLEWVVAALQASNAVDDVVIVGIEAASNFQFLRPVHFIPDQGSLVENGLAGLDYAQKDAGASEHILLCTSDIPTLRPGVVDYFVNACQPFDCALYYCFVTRDCMDVQFPKSNRTFVKLKGKDVAGGDMVLALPALANLNMDLFHSLAAGRKHAWKIARLVGPKILTKLVLRRLTIADIEISATKVIGDSVKIIISPHPELAMDVDKPHHVELLRSYFNT